MTSPCVENHGKALFQLAKDRGLEGIIAKRKTSSYQAGRRSPDNRLTSERTFPSISGCEIPQKRVLGRYDLIAESCHAMIAVLNR